MIRPWILSELLRGHLAPGSLPAQADSILVRGLQMDSRLIEEGDLFFAAFGNNHDARDYIDNAVQRGAVAVLAQADSRWQGLQWRASVPVICLDDLTCRVSAIAGRFHGDPAQQLVAVGVTGTNGKTSCTQFLAQLITGLEQTCGVVGTLGLGLYPELGDSGYTTPDAIAVQSALAQFVAAGACCAAIEASSQGLHQHRLAAVPFHTAVFTNLSRDHLDYHQSMSQYGDAKKKLFSGDALQVAIVNADDPFASDILNDLPSRVRSLTYSLTDRRASVHLSALRLQPNGYQAAVVTPWGEAELQGSLLGEFNISNVLAVLCAAMTTPLTGQPLELTRAAQLLSALRPVRGRMEVVGCRDEVSVVVDYAHTPDALRSALKALGRHYRGKIHCVFGCGGNRDQGKRPLMAETAEALADRVIITDDNPRLEAADDIVRQIMLGIEDRSKVLLERDRARAIRAAISAANAGDVVLLAGKGHENYQDVAGQRLPFDDAEQARQALQERVA